MLKLDYFSSSLSRGIKRTAGWSRVFCSILAMIVLGTGSALAELPPAPVGIGGNFILTGTDGRPVSLGDFKGKTVLLFFGYTYCPDVCPTTLYNLTSVRDMLGDKASQFSILFITVDPERDTLKNLQTYETFFGPSVTALRGSSQQTAKVAALYRSSYKKDETGSASEYLIGHTDFIFLIDGQGRTRSMYRSHTPAKKIVDDILELTG